MRSKYKNYILFFLMSIIFSISLITILFFIKKDKKDSSVVNEGNEVRVMQSNVMETLNNVDCNRMYVENNKFYYSYIDEDKGKLFEYFHYIDLKDLKEDNLFLKTDLGKERILCFTSGFDHNLYFLSEVYEQDSIHLYIKTINKDGELEIIANVNQFAVNEGDDYNNWRLEMSYDGNAILYSPYARSVISLDGQIIEKTVFSEENRFQLKCLEGGQELHTKFVNGARELYLIPKDSKEPLLLKNIPTNSQTFEVVNDSANSFLIKTDTELYRYDINKKSLKSVMIWTQLGIAGQDLSLIYKSEEGIGGFLFQEDEIINVFGEVKSEVNNEVKDKQQLLLGCIGETSEMDQAVAKFNQENKNYEILIKDYMVFESDYINYEQSMNMMYNAILSGKGPDILSIDTDYIDFMQLGDKGILEDLNPYIDQSQEVEKKDFVDSVITACTFESHLFALPTNFGIDTIIGTSDVFNNQSSWEIEDLLKIVDENSQTKIPMSNIDKNNFFDLCVKYGILFGMIREGNDFSKEKFIEYLTTSDKMPDIAMFNTDYSLYKNGKILTESSAILHVESYLFEKSRWGGNMTIIGYPEVNGNGSVLVPRNAWGIIAGSTHKDVAWEFIEKYFTDEWQNNGMTPNWNFSVLKDTLDKQLLASTQKIMYTDELGNSKETPVDSYMDGDEEIFVFAATEEDINVIRELIEGMEVVRTNDFSLSNIIREEAAAYFSKEKNAEEVADIVENRLKIYFGEKGN